MSTSQAEQLYLFDLNDSDDDQLGASPPRKPPSQLLKWVGNKQRFAPEITRYIPSQYHRYIEPFVGTGAVLGALAPRNGLAGDTLEPLIRIWQLVQQNPESLIASYKTHREEFIKDSAETYDRVKASYNAHPNPYDLLFISRSCYGGVVRFTKEGTISTPIGPHTPIPADKFGKRTYAWHEATRNTQFVLADFSVTMAEAQDGDVVYCDPPYVYCQSILYGAQEFSLLRLWTEIEGCVRRGAKVLLSIDGAKKSGKQRLDVDMPTDLFKHEIMIDCGRSMLRRFQRSGESLEDEVVHDRLMLTW